MAAVRPRLFWSLVAAWCALFAAAEVSATLANPVMWILVHHRLKQARIDPIVTPGKPSSHVHSLVGVNGVSEDTTTAQALEEASTCTTSGIHADMSAYWAPTLYSFNSDNDTFTPRPLDYVNTYYLMRGNVPITAFPRGLQLLAGNATRRGPGPTRQNDNTASFVCLNYQDGSSQWPTLPPGPCPQGLRTQVTFPSCWNGKDLVTADHSHVVYPLGDNADNGDCPSSHKTRLPTLFYEFVWGVDGQDNVGNSTWVFSNGDAIGYSFHADFIAAWNETILQGAIDQCAGNLFNDLESCPPLAETLDRKASQMCNTTSSEAISGSIASLPGCNVVWNGPHAGKGLTPGCDPNKVMLKPANWPASNSTNATTPSPSSALASSSTVSTHSAASTSAANTPAAVGNAAAGQTPKSVTQAKKPINKAPVHKQPAHKHTPKQVTVQSHKKTKDPVFFISKKKDEKKKKEKKSKKQRNH
ncbi:hypothetical protein EX895_003160 [Sporisorium graminicola]|uniref:DUF1996 domain-containing protein n=1 Tax=Sporisorium graminicola TaxID=280036 RepID=A0A4U7KTZ3_9BASI|nr:hypothetical protein EX895_003160 [Sporisorium graminicola]TKY88064.1 hypothetical protein EX895_003160 [Sporisorium graminicola]